MDKAEVETQEIEGEAKTEAKVLNEGAAEVKGGDEAASEGEAAKPALTAEQLAEKLKLAEKAERENKHLRGRIDKLTGQKRQLEETLSSSKTSTGAAAESTPQNEAFRKAVDVAAAAKAAQEKFDADCMAAVQRGKVAYEDFESRLASFRSEHMADDVPRYANFIGALMELDAPEKLIYELSQDPAETSRLMALSPVKQGIELSKLAGKIAEPKQVSNVAKPIPVLRGASHEAIDPRDPERASKLTTQAWMERRQKQVDEAWQKDHPRRAGRG